MAKGIAHREWAIYRADYETEADFRAAVENEQALNVHIQERLGVGIVSAPRRYRDEFGNWQSESYVFQTATVPAAAPAVPVAPPVVEVDVEDDETDDFEPSDLVERAA